LRGGQIALRDAHAKSADTQLSQGERAGGRDHLELVEQDVVDVDLELDRVVRLAGVLAPGEMDLQPLEHTRPAAIQGAALEEVQAFDRQRRGVDIRLANVVANTREDLPLPVRSRGLADVGEERA